MRLAALVLAALLVAAAPATADAKPLRYGAKPAKRAKKRPGTGWVAKVVRVAPAPPAPAAPAAPPVDGPPAEQPAEAPPAPVVTPPPAPLCNPSPWIGVTADDVNGFRLRLTRTCVPAGTVLFNFRNDDLAVHNLWAEGVAPAAAKRRVIDDTDGETVVTGSAQLAAGQWRLFCSLPGHEAMSRLVDVTPAG